MLRRARKKWSGDIPDICFKQADIRDLSRYSGFDAAFSNATLHRVKEAEQAAKQIAGELRPGGRSVADLGLDGLANWYTMFVKAGSIPQCRCTIMVVTIRQ